ncbi:hypothetical protein SCHPADRAFT_859820 [Schizopora paradoxa]|uniref:BTB domain-containing protein n=1 Tax=Schizopora paradoxa TaxID=27342 RepID=A0A0H2R8Q2_9AGAM|nr:hypothetical protein SCHPADRAFT_859820 [Schizopora paradoxa]
MDVDQQLGKPPITPKPHDILWFLDGNVVLATDTYLFKVHKSLLSLHSSVFKDMFELPNIGHESSNLEGPGRSDTLLASLSYEGVPMVTMIGDKGKDVAHLLRAVFEPDYYHRDNDETPLEVIVALLLLSTKYDFNVVRKSVILHISRHYPMTLQEYDALYINDPPMFGKERRAECHFPLLAAAVTADVDVLLPGLFLACSEFGIDEIFSKTQSMTRETQRTLMNGRESISCAKGDLISSLSEQLRRYDTRGKCQNETPCLKEAYFRDTGLFVLLPLGDAIGKKAVRSYISPICRGCSSVVARMIDENRAEIWKDVLSFFDLSEWEQWEDFQAKLKVIVES